MVICPNLSQMQLTWVHNWELIPTSPVVHPLVVNAYGWRQWHDRADKLHALLNCRARDGFPNTGLGGHT